MTIDPFWAGVFCTVFLEMAALIVAGLWKTIKK